VSTDASSYGATSTTLSTAIREKWEADVLKTATGNAVAAKFSRGKVMGKGEGGTYTVNRILRPSKVTSADTEGHIFGYADAKALTTNEIQITPSKWGDSFGFTSESNWDSLLQDKDKKDVIANQMARSCDYQIMKTLATGSMRHRIDKDANNQVSGTITTADTAGTSAISTSLGTNTNALWTTASSYFAGGYMTITSPDGGCYDETSKVSAWTGAAGSGDATVAFSNGLTTASDFRLVVGTDIAASDKLSITGLLDVAALHSKVETERFSGGLLRGFLDSAQERDLWDDTTFLDSAIYDNSDRFRNYKLMRWLDMEFLISSGMYREDVDGTENPDTGVVYVTPIFGDNSYTVVKWDSGHGDFAAKFHFVDKPDSGNLRNDMKWISWNARFGSKVLRATSVVGLMTGATSLNVVGW